MNKLYIITEEGRAFSTKGLEVVTADISTKKNLGFDPNDETIYIQGAAYNDLSTILAILKQDLATHDKSFLVGSFDDGVTYTPVNEKTFEILKGIQEDAKSLNSARTTWEILKSANGK